VGKSALAVRAAHLLRPAYPDGQLYVDLSTGGDTMAVLATLLRSLGISDRDQPGTLGERTEAWRDLLARRRLLLVVDQDAVDQDIGALLPSGRGSAVLITARRRTPELSGVEWHNLAGLSTSDGVSLLARIVGEARVEAELEAARQLVCSGQGFPLRIRVAAERLLARPAWSIASEG
jgi:predicted ATPase